MKTSKWVALAFWVTVGISMIVEGRYEPIAGDAVSFSLTLLAALLMFGWYLADSNENDIPRSMVLNFAVILIGILAVPYYRFRYFGTRRGVVFIGWVLAILAGTAIIATLLLGLLFGLDA